MATAAILEPSRTLKAHQLHKVAQAIPLFLYGTAWKKETSASLVHQALTSGFSGLDTANQPKHYREDLVGLGLKKVLSERQIKRQDLYVQTKYTPLPGQDPNHVPYNPKDPIFKQVQASVESSLKHLGGNDHGMAEHPNQEPYIDTLVLHSPLSTVDETMEAWQTLEGYVPVKIRNLGVSNCDLFTLRDIYERATIKPAIVQNRFYADTKFDIGLRKFCQEKSIVYQSFWTLTANPSLLRSDLVVRLSEQLRSTPQAALYCLVLGLGNTVILNGTKSVEHMRQDLEGLDRARSFASEDSRAWEDNVMKFRRLIGEPC